MANPVAIYSPDPAAPPPRGGSGSAQIIQIDVYRSGPGARFTPDRDSQDAQLGDTPQGARSPTFYPESVRTQVADQVRRTTRYDGRTPQRRLDDGALEAGRRRAPASLSFAAQQIAQEDLPPGVYFENFKPAIAAYMIAAARPTIPPPGQALEMSA